MPPPFAPALRVRDGRPGAEISSESRKLFSFPGVSNTFSLSLSSMSSSPPFRLPSATGVGSSSLRRVNCAALGGDGVDNGADDVAVEPEACRRFRPGVEKPEANEGSERSSSLPLDRNEAPAMAAGL